MQEIEEVIAIKEEVPLQVRLTAIGCYGLQLSEWGMYEKAFNVASSAFASQLDYDRRDVNLSILVEQIKHDTVLYETLWQQQGANENTF